MGEDRAFQNPKRHDYELMNTWAVILVLTTTLLLLLPLLPALKEMYFPTDVTPLKVVQAYDNDPFHFASGFRKYVQSQFSVNSIADLGEARQPRGQLTDGTYYQIVRDNDSATTGVDKDSQDVILSNRTITLASGRVFEAEIYSAAGTVTGANSRFRALLSDQAMTIDKNSILLRWAHSNGAMNVGENCVLMGRATSNDSITLASGCHFERLHAPRIIIGVTMPPQDVGAQVERVQVDMLKNIKLRSEKRIIIEGDLDFPAYGSYQGDIVAGTTAIVGDYAHIKGSLKSNAMNDVALALQNTGVTFGKEKTIARCELGHYVRIDGSVVSTHDLFIGEHCRIFGPVIAENLLVIRTGTIIGSPENPCTVYAPRIIIESGCVIHGTLRAAEEGIVVPAQHNIEGMAA